MRTEEVLRPEKALLLHEMSAELNRIVQDQDKGRRATAIVISAASFGLRDRRQSDAGDFRSITREGVSQSADIRFCRATHPEMLRGLSVPDRPPFLRP